MVPRLLVFSLLVGLTACDDTKDSEAAKKKADDKGDDASKSKGKADQPEPDAPDDAEPDDAKPDDAKPGAIDIEGGDAEALCKQLMPDDIHALGVADRWSKNRKLVAKKTYGNRRVRCHWEGADPSGPSPKASPYFEVEVGCGEKDPAGLCKAKLGDQAIKKVEVIAETIDGAQCHTLSAEGSGNWVVMPNGCYAIVYKAQPDIMGIDADERTKRRADTNLAVGRALAAKLSGS